jgi:hypothetical protein
LDIELAKQFKLILGPTLNGFAGLDNTVPDNSTLPVMFSVPLYSQMVISAPVNIWIGATAGFRF